MPRSLPSSPILSRVGLYRHGTVLGLFVLLALSACALPGSHTTQHRIFDFGPPPTPDPAQGASAGSGPARPTIGFAGIGVPTVLDSTTIGAIPLTFLDVPNLRGLSFRIEKSIGSDQLTGVPTDIAFDDLLNLGALRDDGNPFSNGRPAEIEHVAQYVRTRAE